MGIAYVNVDDRYRCMWMQTHLRSFQCALAFLRKVCELSILIA
jgi:hypothetical protein